MTILVNANYIFIADLIVKGIRYWTWSAMSQHFPLSGDVKSWLQVYL